ncbi:MAG: DAK2 domain-containing protein [Candidatus Nanopelagicales bacterium]
MMTVLDIEALARWASLALADMADHRASIDALNVFPVPDGDTGTNMYLTLEAGVAAMSEVLDSAPNPGSARLSALAKGALLGARGNSGVILSELLRGLAATRAADVDRPTDGAWLAAALATAAERAHAAVSQPKEGTVLTVARAAAAAASAAAQSSGGDLAVTTQAAAERARAALAETTEQLEVLKRAGVVDAGGRGFVVLTDALLETVSGVHRDLPEFEPLHPVLKPVQGAGAHAGSYGGPAYEVMYLLEAADDGIPGLRARFGELGDSVVVVGGDGLWNVHVHCDDAGAAIEAGLELGRLSRIRVTYLEITAGNEPAGRGLVTVTHGQGVSELLEAQGVTTVRAPAAGRTSTAEMLAGIVASGAGEVILLPSDKDSLPVAEAAAKAARKEGLRVAVIPTRSVVQSLAAIAVHDGEATFDDDVVEMTRAAAHTRYAGLTTASRDALTSAGQCRIGDEIGVVAGDIVEIGQRVRDVAERVLARLLDRGGELVTVVLGADAPPELLDHLSDYALVSYPSVEVVGYEGGQPHWHAIIGVE